MLTLIHNSVDLSYFYFVLSGSKQGLALRYHHVLLGLHVEKHNFIQVGVSDDFRRLYLNTVMQMKAMLTYKSDS